LTALVREAAVEAVGAENVIESPLGMGGEDFSYFSLERPACFFNVGTRSEDRGITWGHHHPRFDVEEEGMAAGIATMGTAVLNTSSASSGPTPIQSDRIPRGSMLLPLRISLAQGLTTSWERSHDLLDNGIRRGLPSRHSSGSAPTIDSAGFQRRTALVFHELERRLHRGTIGATTEP
jgi:hypothetical protein